MRIELLNQQKPHMTVLVLLLGLLSLHIKANELSHPVLAEVCEVSPALVINKPISKLNEEDFSVEFCQTQRVQKIDPEKRLLWVKIILNLDSETTQSTQPLGVFISGKASSSFYINGHFVGSNGRPALHKENELPGAIDAAFPLKADLLKSQGNELIVLLSAHHGFLDLGSPIQNIFVGEYHNLTDKILRHYWPSMLPFGVLLLGSFYLLLVARINEFPIRAYLLPLMAALAASQLFLEIYRGLVAYLYPFHDWRLLLILICSFGFGLCLMVYVLSLINLKQRYKHLLFAYPLITFMVVFVAGFDVKNILALLLPVTLSLLYAAVAWHKGQKDMRFVFMMLLVFMAMILMNSYVFIDTVYYYCVAFLIFTLMAQQAFQIKQIRKLQLKDQARAAHLQQVIDQQTVKNSAAQIEIRSAGKIEWVKINEIAYCKGAGDYIELILLDGNIKLFHGSLATLSLRLPTIFLKTHRSYLVNTTLIESLERSSSGAGRLLLSHGFNVPVSRRILPKVKERLG